MKQKVFLHRKIKAIEEFLAQLLWECSAMFFLPPAPPKILWLIVNVPNTFTRSRK